jgi:hypothetical protein
VDTSDPSVTGAEAGVGTFTDSMTASSTLSILLLLLGVAAGIFDAFGSSASRNRLRTFDCSAAYFSSGPSASSILASAGAERLGSDMEEDPSTSFGASSVSMRLGRWVRTLTFFDFDALEVAEVAVFLFFPYFRE